MFLSLRIRGCGEIFNFYSGCQGKCWFFMEMVRLKRTMSWIANEQSLLHELRDHKLIGNYQGRRECHLASDWLLIYKIEKGIVIFERTGSHSKLLKK